MSLPGDEETILSLTGTEGMVRIPDLTPTAWRSTGTKWPLWSVFALIIFLPPVSLPSLRRHRPDSTLPSFRPCLGVAARSVCLLQPRWRPFLCGAVALMSVIIGLVAKAQPITQAAVCDNDRRSLRWLRGQSCAAVWDFCDLATGRRARRKLWRHARDLTQRRHGPDADHAGNLAASASALRSRHRSRERRNNILQCRDNALRGPSDDGPAASGGDACLRRRSRSVDRCRHARRHNACRCCGARMDRGSAVSHAARQQRATIAAVFQCANRAAVARHYNSGSDASFSKFGRTVRVHIAADIAAMSSLARHHAVEGFGAGWRVASRQPRNPAHGRQGKRPAVGAAHVVGRLRNSSTSPTPPAGAFGK
jgi:hypothetical protein